MLHSSTKKGDDGEESYDASHAQGFGCGPDTNWLIHPHSLFRSCWDILTCTCIFYQMILVPYRIAFEPEINVSTVGFWLDLAIDGLFMIDIALNFRTGIAHKENQSHIIFDKGLVRSQYYTTWFWIDVIACVPIDVMVYFGLKLLNKGGGGTKPKVVQMLRVLRVSKLIKLLRLFKLKTLLDHWEEMIFRVSFNPGIRRLVLIFFWVCILAHIVGCGWYFIASFSTSKLVAPQSWVSHYFDGIDERDVNQFTLYLTSLYWSITTLTSVGFGDVVATSNTERAYALIVMIIGASIFGYIIGNMSTLVANLNQTETAFQSKLDGINSYLRYRKVPHDLQVKIRRYFKYYLGRKTMFDEKGILEELSHYLRSELSIFLIQDVLGNTDLFDQSEPIFLTSLVTMLKPFSAIPNDYIIREGEIGVEMYVLVTGLVEVMSGDETITYALLGPGNHFGEISPIVPSEQAPRRTATVKAVEYCDLFSLHKSDLDDVLEGFPEVSKRLLATARQRINITKNLRKGKLRAVHKHKKALEKRKPSIPGIDSPTYIGSDKVSPLPGNDGDDRVVPGIRRVMTRDNFGVQRPRKSIVMHDLGLINQVRAHHLEEAGRNSIHRSSVHNITPEHESRRSSTSRRDSRKHTTRNGKRRMTESTLTDPKLLADLANIQHSILDSMADNMVDDFTTIEELSENSDSDYDKESKEPQHPHAPTSPMSLASSHIQRMSKHMENLEDVLVSSEKDVSDAMKTQSGIAAKRRGRNSLALRAAGKEKNITRRSSGASSVSRSDFERFQNDTNKKLNAIIEMLQQVTEAKSSVKRVASRSFILKNAQQQNKPF